jgi:cystinosin
VRPCSRSCYAAYNAALFWDPLVRKEYACLNGGAMPAVHANDVFFALHAFVVTAITLVQCAIYDRGGQRVSWPAALGVGGAAASIAAYLAAVIGAAAQGGGGPGAGSMAEGGPACGTILSWLSFLYFLSYIKLAVSLVKYIPQVSFFWTQTLLTGAYAHACKAVSWGVGHCRNHSVVTPTSWQVWLNYRRKSTLGWTIHNVLLDFTGGLLSLVQLAMDSAVTRDWGAITGAPLPLRLEQHWHMLGQ